MMLSTTKAADIPRARNHQSPHLLASSVQVGIGVGIARGFAGGWCFLRRMTVGGFRWDILIGIMNCLVLILYRMKIEMINE